jgi:hypothetical protein
MRKVHTLAVAFATVASITGFTAASAMAENTYAVDGSGTKGGTPSKPKPALLKEVFSTGTTLGDTFQPKPVIKFKITIEGGRLNHKALDVLAKCKPTPDDSEDPSADQCPAKSIVGGGVLTAVVGVPETVFNPALKCDLPFKEYNVGPNGLLGLFIDAKPPRCPIPVKQWVLIKTVQVGRNVTTTIEVPKALQEIATNTFATVVKSTFEFRPILVKVKGKTQSVTESIGCADKIRTVSVEFTDIDGGKGNASKNLACK